MSTPSASRPGSAAATPAFARIVCGVDDTRAATEAARQAAALAKPGGAIELVAVARSVGFGPTRMAELSPARAERRLDQLRRELDDDALRLTTNVVPAEHPAAALMDVGASADLISVGARPGGRAGGIALGSTSSALLHRAPVSVLVARRSPDDRPFASRILVASDGSANARAAVRTAEALVHARGADVVLVQAANPSAEQRHHLAADSAILKEAMGKEPVVLSEPGRPQAVITRLAKTTGVSLVVVGSRGLHGVAALGSVSERVAHDAHCSVLVVRPDAAR